MSEWCNIGLLIFVVMKKNWITSGRCLNIKQIICCDKRHYPFSFSHCFLWDLVGQLNNYVNAVIKTIFLVYMSCLNVLRGVQEDYALEQHLFCCDPAYWIYCYNLLRLSVVTNLPVKSKPVTRDDSEALWEFIVRLAGATLCFNVLYFFNALLVQWNPFPNWTLPQIKTDSPSWEDSFKLWFKPRLTQIQQIEG